MDSILAKLVEVLSANTKSPTQIISYDGRTLRFKYDLAYNNQLRGSFQDFSINANFYPNEECEIEIDKKYNNNTIIFLDENDFIKRINNYKNDFDLINLIILSYDRANALKEIGEQFSPEKALFFNVLGYQSLIDFFAHNTDFISLHDQVLHQFIIFSGDKGPFYIGYNSLDVKVKTLPDLNLELKKINEAFSRIDFIQFFKEAVINGIHKEPVEDRFFILIQSLHVLLELATRDHRIYLKKFGFDKIKAKFKEERIKYFDSIEKNIDAVSKQVTSFPLTFAASIFAGYQVKSNSAILLLILTAYALYTFVAWKILAITSLNNDNIKADVESEELKIKNEYNILFDEFKSDFQKIRDKICRLKDLIQILRFILLGLLLSFLIFFLYETFVASSIGIKPTEVRIVD